jgi:copper(I)-binding protein
MFLNLKKLFYIFLLVPLLPMNACTDNSLVIKNFSAAAMQDTSAGYGTIINKTNSTINIVSIAMPDYWSGIAAIHKTTLKNGIASMKKINSLIIEPNNIIIFEPGSYHIMFTEIQNKFKSGDSHVISFIDANQNIYPATLTIKSMSEINAGKKSMDHSKMEH